jgi:polyisoprenoid-binding protein YceI
MIPTLRALIVTPAAILAAAAAAAAQPVTWQIDPVHSTATFAVRHMMVTTVRGTFQKLAGTVQFDGKDVKTIVAQATINVASIDTREPKRDEHLRSADFFDAATFPTITFASKRVEPKGAGRFALVGDLTIKGVTREVTLDVEGPTPEIKDPGGNIRIGASATTRINRQDFGVSWNRALDAGGVVVGDEVAITLDLSLIRKGPGGTK